MVDALGNELVIGNTYGYSSRDGSNVTVTIGTLKSLGQKKASLTVIHSDEHMYGCKSRYSNPNKANTVSVSPIILFPVNLPTTAE